MVFHQCGEPLTDSEVQPGSDSHNGLWKIKQKENSTLRINLCRAGAMLATVFLATALTVAGQEGRSVFVLTSTNSASGNAVVVFQLDTVGTPSLTWVDTLPTGGNGGASGNAGILQFGGDFGAVANFASNSVSQLVREANLISVGRTINLAPGCLNPDSVALAKEHLYVVGTTCAESHAWPWGQIDGTVNLTDRTAAQIAVGRSWAAVTQTDGYLLQLPLTQFGALSGTFTDITLQPDADSVPLGEAFWGDVLGFTPAHSAENFAIVSNGTEYPIPGTSFFSVPTQAPCWVAKGAGNIWYTGNSPGHAISIFFSDSQGGAFYKSVPLQLMGTPTDITVSPDRKWLAVIYTYQDEGYIAVYSIDAYGGLTYAATSPSVGVAAFNGVAFSQ
jgi:hypothetical protein